MFIILFYKLVSQVGLLWHNPKRRFWENRKFQYIIWGVKGRINFKKSNQKLLKN
jgi:hypothetical protein